MLNPIYYINGNWVKKSDARISANDAGFLLGDGLFETIRFQNKNLFLIDKHLSRLKSGLKTIKIMIRGDPHSIKYPQNSKKIRQLTLPSNKS